MVRLNLVNPLSTEPTDVRRNRLRVIVIVELADEEVVRRLQPKMALPSTVPTQGGIVTSHSTVPESDFVSRFFGLAVGVPEDPVTGSARCCVGP